MFAEYCESLREEGTDIDLWTLQELEDLVMDFKSQYNGPIEPQNYQEEEYDEDHRESQLNQADILQPEEIKDQDLKSEPINLVMDQI